MARALMEEDLALFREVGDQQRVAWSLFTLALLDSKQGEYARAQTLLGESLALHRKLGNTRGIAASLSVSERVNLPATVKRNHRRIGNPIRRL